jgi:membrane protease YdiL (CAAX protease family)
MKQHFPNIKQSFVLILQLFLISIPAAIPSIAFFVLADLFESSPAISGHLKSFGVLLAYVISFFWIIKIAKTKIKNTENSLTWKFKKVPFRLLAVFLIMSLALTVLIDPLTELIPMPKSFEDMFKEMLQANIFAFLTLVVAAPVFEELFFRGIILEGFLKNYSARKAIIWSAIIFGSAHMNPWQFIGAGFAGLFIAWAYYKTGSLIPAMFIHFVNNLIGFIVGIASKGELFSFYEMFSNKTLYFAMYGLSAVIFTIGIFAINRQYMFPVKESMN